MPTIPTTSSTPPAAGPATKATSGAMGKDDFLKLMTTQLRRQDPMHPVDDTAFLAQMAQFTSLEQLTNLGTTAAQQLAAQSVSQAVALSGRTVTYTGADGTPATGVVDAVVLDGGVPTLTVGGVPGVPPSAVTSVHGAPASTPVPTATPAASTSPSAATGGPTTTTE